MSAVEHIPITIQDDFLVRQTRALPTVALSELIWNSLDGEASRVEVEFERNDLAGGLSKIVVYDDGEGFARSDAAKLFGNLGGSWKRIARRTRTKSRMVGGKSGAKWNDRPFLLDWARNTRDQCADSGVCFFMKQTAAFRPNDSMIPDDLMIRQWPKGH